MTPTLRPHARAWPVALIGALAVAAAVLVALTLAPRANAAFSTPQCRGTDIVGRGASFARDAHGAFKLNFETFFCPGGPAADYEPLGSGAGREVVGARRGANVTGDNSRNQIPRFGMSDEAPSTTEVNDINRGTNAAGDEDRIHVIPAAVGAVAPLVNFPDNCDVTLLPEAERTAEQNQTASPLTAASDDVVRVRFTKAKFESAWAKDPGAGNWVQLFPSLAADADCNKAITRVVRFDESGTTFAFKDYLDTINRGRGWLTTFGSGGDSALGGTRRWPGAVFAARADCAGKSGPGSEPDATDQLTSGCSNGNGPLVSKLIETDGSIGYSDISTARTANPSLAITPEANDNDTYWTQIPNGNGCADLRSCTTPEGNTFTEPTASSNGFRTDGPKGSFCQSTAFRNVPESTLGDWAPVSGVNSAQGYGICTLTYGLLFDDYAKAYSASSAAQEEPKARTVKDYWTDIVGAGQNVLFSNDYAPLPTANGILDKARAGVNAIGWDKSATGGGGSTPPPSGGSTPPPTGGGSTPPPPVATPSNRFSITRTTINSRRGRATISVRVPGRGTIQAVATARSNGRRFRVGGVRIGVTRAGTYRLTIKPGRTAKRILNRARRLRTTVRLSYKPTGGTTRSVNRIVTLKLRRGARAG